MRRRVFPAFLALAVPSLLVALGAGCTSGPKSALELAQLDPEDMDTSVSPADDFYRYANGGWMDRSEIPAAYPQWGMGTEVNERNQVLLRTILEEAAADAGTDGLGRKLGSFYGSGMDTAAIESAGAEPLGPELAAIDGVRTAADLARVVARLHSVGVGVFFGVGSEAGLEDTSTTMFWVAQSGLGLPDRDYYTRDDEDSASLREQYVAHVERMLEMLGRAKAADEARTVMALETRLAEASLTNVELRDPQNYDRHVTRDELEAGMPHFDWDTYLDAIGLPDLAEANQPMPGFHAEVDAMLAEVPLDDWKAYMRWHLVSQMAPALSSDFEDENFRFFGTTLSGTEEQLPRWRRVLQATSGALGEALGQLYVDRAFSANAKERAQEMVRDLIDVMGDRLRRVEWMGEETRQRALAKLAAFGWKIGYPDVWRDYTGLEVGDDSYARNQMRAASFDFRYQMSKVSRPVDENEWGMTPQMLNAYYHPLRNEIVFPAAILQPPFFSEHSDDPLNYGAIGAVIGHEITHGFDDMGSQFDADGALRNWWTDEDRTEFESRARRLVDQYGAYEVAPGVNVNGQLTLGENIADLGGVSIAFEAMQRANEGVADPMIDGFTREQRFFLAFARVWRRLAREEALKLQVNTDTHSPARFRATGPLANLQEFADAFDMPADAAALIPEDDRARIW